MEQQCYWAERAKLAFIESLHCIMQRHGISRAELARRLGSSPAYITKALRGDANFTFETMTRLARAVDGKFRCRIDGNGPWVPAPHGMGRLIAVSGSRETGRTDR